VGPVGKIATEIIEKNDISRIISLDATAKLEGEKTGRLAEGIGGRYRRFRNRKMANRRKNNIK
jgi:hypothetical protein